MGLGVKPAQAYALRVALAEAGHVVVPCQNGKPVLDLEKIPSEGTIRSWAIRFPEATETGIWSPKTRSVTLVTKVPGTRNQQFKEAKRRAAGSLPRAEWLEKHRTPPWEGSGMSRASFYRARKRETGAAGGGGDSC
jgi:hypothetical protein